MSTAEELPWCLASRTAALRNLGNTCFMNSSLQCLANIPALRDLFLTRELPTASSPAAQLSQGFARLMRALWNDTARTLSPLEFKALVCTRFGREQQHDCMEFLEFVLDALREELGSEPVDGEASTDPLLQALRQYATRSNSDIDELFVGCTKTGLECPACGRSWEVFDAALSLKLPSADPAKAGLQRVVVAVLPQSAPAQQVCLQLREGANCGEVLAAAADRIGVRLECCALINMADGIARFPRETDGSNVQGQLLLYELPDERSAALFAEVGIDCGGEADEASDERRVCPDDGQQYSFRELRKAFEGQYSAEDLKAYWRDSMATLAPEGAACGIVLHCRQHGKLLGPPLIFSAQRRTTLEELTKAIREQLAQRFGARAGSGWRLVHASAGWDAARAEAAMDAQEQELRLRECEHLVADWEFAAPVPAALPPPSEEICSLEGCFQWFTATERLDSVLCSGCSERVAASARASLALLPPVLVVQLKRFEYRDGRRRRLCTRVRAPLEGLDLRQFCGAEGLRVRSLRSSTGAVEDSVEDCPSVYDLAAVCSHIGAAAAGHYVAYVRSGENGLWYLFDDERVTEVDAEEVEANDVGAYVLFYLRRDFRPGSWGAPKAAAPTEVLISGEGATSP